MNNLINNKNNLSVNTRRFKCVGLLVLLATLTNFTHSRAMGKNKEEMVSQTTNKKEANKKLFEARTPEKVQEALSEGADINTKYYYGYTPLNFACENRLEEVALKLIEKGADVNATLTDPWHKGWTPLFFACQECLEKVAFKLIEKGADVNAALTDGMDKGMTPLHSACLKRLEKVALKLIEKGANVNAAIKNGWTPLHYACFINSMDIVKLLLENGANPDFTNRDNQTPGQLTRNSYIKDIVNLVSEFIKEQNKSKRDAFIVKNTGKDNAKFNLDREFWKKVELSNIKLGRIKLEPFKLFERTKAYNDMNVIAEKEKLDGNENQEN